MNCQKCNFQNEDSAKFCGNCGAKLRKAKQYQYGNSKITWTLVLIVALFFAWNIWFYCFSDEEIHALQCYDSEKANLIYPVPPCQDEGETYRENQYFDKFCVVSKKAYIYSSPSEDACTRKYLIEGSEVKSIGCQEVNGFVRIRFRDWTGKDDLTAQVSDIIIPYIKLSDIAKIDNHDEINYRVIKDNACIYENNHAQAVGPIHKGFLPVGQTVVISKIEIINNWRSNYSDKTEMGYAKTYYNEKVIYGWIFMSDLEKDIAIKQKEVALKENNDRQEEATVNSDPMEIIRDMIRCAKKHDEAGLRVHFVSEYTDWWSFDSWVGSEYTYDISIHNTRFQTNSIFNAEVHCKAQYKLSSISDIYADNLAVFDFSLEKQANGEWKAVECLLSQEKSKKSTF